MIGASRGSLIEAERRLQERADEAGFAAIPAELRAVATLLGQQTQLRGALSDSGTPAKARLAIVGRLLDGKVSALAVEVTQDVVALRWSEPRDLIDALERLAAQVSFTVAEREGRLDQVENELFAVSRAYDASPRLQLTLTDPALPADRKIAIVRDLLGGRAQPETVDAVAHVVADPRGRKLERAIDALVDLAAIRRQSVVAVATVALPLESDQAQRLTVALGRVYGRKVNLQQVVDPQVVGGIRVEVGDEVIDGSLAQRLEQVRRLIS